jgi:hypothetical protein
VAAWTRPKISAVGATADSSDVSVLRTSVASARSEVRGPRRDRGTALWRDQTRLRFSVLTESSQELRFLQDQEQKSVM